MSIEQRHGLRRPYAQISGSVVGLLADERIVGRDGVVVAVLGLVDVDPQDLAVQIEQILAVAVEHVVADAPVVGVAAVAGRDVEIAVRAKADPVAVVIELRPVDRGDDSLAERIGSVRIIFGHRIFGDHVGVRPPQLLAGIATPVEVGAVGDVELPIVRVVGVERQAEQPALVEQRTAGDAVCGECRGTAGSGLDRQRSGS